MKNLGGPLLLASVGTLAVVGGLIPLGGSKQPIPGDDGMPDIHQNVGGNSADNPGVGTKGYENPELPPDPPPGSIPPGSTGTQTGEAAIDFDGTGYYPPGDTHIAATAYTVDGQYLNGDTTKYVVVNRDLYGNVPMGSKVYVYNHDTNQGTWAIAGDRGPTQSKSEMSTATANAIGVNIPKDSNGNYKNSADGSHVSYYFY